MDCSQRQPSNVNAPSAMSQGLQQNSHACLAIVDFSNLLSATPLALHVLSNNQRPTVVPHQNSFVNVSKVSMAPGTIVPSVDVVIGARAILKGLLALRVPAQHPQCRAVLKSAVAKRAGSP